MSRLAQTARLLKVANDDARPFFQPSLRFLVMRALETDERRSAIYADQTTGEDDIFEAEDAAEGAKKALLDHLLLFHAIDRDLAGRIGGLL